MHAMQILVLFYSGHGAQKSSNKAPVALGVDGQKTNLQQTFLRAADKACKLKDKNSCLENPNECNAIILLMDACMVTDTCNHPGKTSATDYRSSANGASRGGEGASQRQGEAHAIANGETGVLHI